MLRLLDWYLSRWTKRHPYYIIDFEAHPFLYLAMLRRVVERGDGWFEWHKAAA